MEKVTLNRHKHKFAAIGVAFILLAVAFSVPVNDEGDTIIESDNSEALAPLVILLLYLIAAETGYILGRVLKDFFNDPPVGNNDIELRNSAAENLVSQIGNALKHDAAYAQDEPYLIGFTEPYFERMGELAAAEIWIEGTAMDRDSILLSSTSMEEYATLMLNRMNIVNSIFEPFKDKAASWDSSSTYDSMDISFVYGSSTLVSHGETLVKYALSTKPSDGQTRAYLYNGGDLQLGYVYATSACTVRHIESGESFRLAAGYNSLAGKPNGMYDLQAGVTYTGSIMQSYSDSAAIVHPGAVLQAGSELVYVMASDSGYASTYKGTNQNITSLTYTVTHDDKKSSIDLLDGLRFISVLFNASKAVFSKTLNAASAAWYLFNAAGESSILASPSALIPNLENMDFNDEQIYLIFMSALPQMSEFYKTASGNFSADDIKISEESLDMICRGTIYTDSGKSKVVSTGYFTPMCFLRDQAVMVGDTAFLQPGMAMLWEKNEDGSYIGSGLRVLESGNVLTISEIDYRGTKYTELGSGVTLKVKSLPDISGYDATGTTDPDISWSMLWMFILIAIIGFAAAYIGWKKDIGWLKWTGAFACAIGVVLIMLDYGGFDI